MKHFLTILLTFVIIAAAMVITCPDKAKHLEAFDEIIDHSINQEETGMAALFSAFGGKRLIHNFFDPLLHVNLASEKSSLRKMKARQCQSGFSVMFSPLTRNKLCRS